MPFWKRIKKCKRGEAPLAFSCLRFLFQAHLRRYSPYPFGSVGKGLERETLCPFPRLRRFGTHYETGSKFLLLFSIKSKEGILCFAEGVPNGRRLSFTEKYFRPKGRRFIFLYSESCNSLVNPCFSPFFML